jgi:titin
MNITNRFRHALVAATLVGTIATAIGAAGVVNADDSAGQAPTTTELQPPSAGAQPPGPSDETSPPGSDTPGTTATPPTDDTPAPPTTVPTSTDPASPAPTTTDAPTTTTPSPPGHPPTTSPPAAIAVPTTTAPPAMVATPAAAVAATAPLSPVGTPANASVKLNWLAPSSNGGATINYYLVQRSTSAAGPWTNNGTPTALTYTSSGLTNGTHYYFRIAAHNSAGYGPFSTVVNAVPRTVPTAPRSPAANPGNGTIKLTWIAPVSTGGAAVDKYAVQRSVNGQWTNVAFPTTLSYTVGGLSNGSNYSFRILAHNAAGWGPASAAVNAVPRTVPSAPLSPLAVAGNQQVALSWKPPSNNGGAAVGGYIVQWSTGDGKWNNYSFPKTTSTIASSAYFANGTRYYFRILASNAAGNSAPSTVVSAVPRTVPGPTGPYCHAQQASYGSTWMVVDWQAPVSDGGAPITYYEITLWRGGVYYDGITVPNNPNHIATLQAYIYGGYDVRIRALNTAGFGAPCWTTAYMWY